MALLTLRGITKRFPGVTALDNVTFSLEAGEIHCLVGENGAGKSTLMNILAGAVIPDGGAIYIDEMEIRLTDPKMAQAMRIGIIHQDFRLVPELTVAENINLGHEPTRRGTCFIDKEQINSTAEDALRRLGEVIDLSIPVRKLTLAQRQVVEIARVLSNDTRILALDEPTASLTDKEVNNLFRVLRGLKSKGVGIIYISHRLEEIFGLGDRVTTLRDGRVIQSSRIAETTKRELIHSMVGRDLTEEFPARSGRPGEQIFRVEHLTTGSIRDISFHVSAGEILGIAGLAGAGRSELARAIFGADEIIAGRIYLGQEEIHPESPHRAIRAGIAFVTEDRNRFGIISTMNVRENITLASLQDYCTGPFIDSEAESKYVRRSIENLGLIPGNPEVSVEKLSGGNRQKVILARWLATRARLIIFDEPTAGIDVGSRYEIYRMINRLADQGLGIMMISSDLPELLGTCNRILVISEGKITANLDARQTSQEEIMYHAVPREERSIS